MKNLIPLTALIVLLSACDSTTPKAELINDKASLPGSFNFDKLGLKVMDSFLNKKTETMSFLYANPVALNNAVKGGATKVAGGVLA